MTKSTRITTKRTGHKLLAAAAAVLLAACSNPDIGGEKSYPVKDPFNPNRYVSGNKAKKAQEQYLFGGGGGGIRLFGDDSEEPVAATGVAVNSYLWRASLDTLSFMPLASADPFGGVIITDWYSPSETPNERFKANVLILDRRLTANGVRVSIFRQMRDQTGNWVDMAVQPETATQMEDTILTRARQLRVGGIG